ncbi:chloroplast sensor kinase, chloroplastic-like [Silene latifolia]|uniref:chloroplast sensor kinase, chloroplastic-like n=1 Tax=Silene latifolia TaxID=37657 RepID=UPI003D774A3F
MLLISSLPSHNSLTNPSLINHYIKHPNHSPKSHSFAYPPKLSSSSLSTSTAAAATLRCVNDPVLDEQGDGEWVPSAAAVAAAIRKVSSSPIEFTHKIEKDPKSQGLVLPTPDFHRLCLDQLALFQRIVHPHALLSVYVRPAGSYVMDRLELRRVTLYPSGDGSDIIILVGNFNMPAGLRGAEAALSKKQAEAVPECGAIVLPMVKHPFVVGFLVAELPDMELGRGSDDSSDARSPQESYALPPSFKLKSPEIPSCSGSPLKYFNLSSDQRLNAINISCSLAMAYVMDQKAMLLQQTSWQNNIRMSNLVEQIRGPLSSLRTLSQMLSVQLKRNEIAHDIVEDIIVQSDRMRDTLQQLQDAVYMTKANIMRFNEESLKKMGGTNYTQPELRIYKLPNEPSNDTSVNKKEGFGNTFSSLAIKDLEMPMPPLALAPLLLHSTRPCNVSDVLVDLVGAAQPLAQKQRRNVELSEFSKVLQVAVEEAALRQALGNLIEGALLRTRVGGNVQIVSVGAPAGGALVVIDDDGPDMHYMTQMHSLTPFGVELSSEQMMEDNMTWNFVAGLTVAREILESYGCVLRVISPRNNDAALGSGGTRIEVWLPSSTPYNHTSVAEEA